jgi:hypothetical protein
MPATLMSFDHFASSSRVNAASASGVLPAGSVARSRKRLLVSASFTAITTSALSRAMIGFGVAVGATTANQMRSS